MPFYTWIIGYLLIGLLSMCVVELSSRVSDTEYKKWNNSPQILILLWPVAVTVIILYAIVYFPYRIIDSGLDKLTEQIIIRKDN